jgi:hypothetical protein
VPYLAFVLVLLLVGCTMGAPNQAALIPTPNATQRAERMPAIPPADAPENRFGIVEGFWYPELTCELGVGWDRIIFNWKEHQPEKSDDWYTLNVDDRWLSAAEACGREVVAVIKHTPDWATDGMPGPGVPSGLDLPIDDPNNLWANFIRMTANYYKDRMGRGVTHFIIWNEPDIEAGTYGFEFEGDIDTYARLLKVAYLVAKEANPEAVIHLAGMTYWHDVNEGRKPYMERLIETIQKDPDAAANGYYFDVVSLNIYFRTDTVYDITQATRQMLNKHGLDDKIIWIAETNAAPTLDPQWKVTRVQFPEIDLEQQATFLVESAALGLAAGAERIGVYKLYDQSLPAGAESFGLLTPADASPRPAFFAWQMVTKTFNPVTEATLAQTPKANVVTMKTETGETLLVAWARTDQAVSLGIYSNATTLEQIGLYGEITPINLTERPTPFTLAGTRCDSKEKCFLGGPVLILRAPAGMALQAEIK